MVDVPVILLVGIFFGQYDFIFKFSIALKTLYYLSSKIITSVKQNTITRKTGIKSHTMNIFVIFCRIGNIMYIIPHTHVKTAGT